MRRDTWLIPFLAVVILTTACAGCATTRQGKPAGKEKQMTEGRTVHVHHAIDYIELTVTSLAEAKRFYGAAFGWRFNDYGESYAGIRGEGREMGGMIQGPEVRPGGPLVILYSRDLDQTVEAVRKAGGRITKEPFTFPGGRRFHFADPSGNELAVWSER